MKHHVCFQRYCLFIQIKVLNKLLSNLGLSGGSVVKNPPAHSGDAADLDLIRGLGRSPRVANGNPLQYSCLGNPMDRGAWWATVHGGHKELDVTELSLHAHALQLRNMLLSNYSNEDKRRHVAADAEHQYK